MKVLVYRVLGLFILAFVMLIFTPKVAQAATFTVTSTADDSAVTPATGCATALPDCTLRSAIEAANAQVGADIINFNIAGGGVHTITPGSALPTIDEQTTIDGTTQSGASCGTLVPTSLPGSNTTHTLLIEIDGSSAGVSTLTIGNSAYDVTIRGLILNNAPSYYSSVQFYQYSATGSLIECNYIGTDSSGTSAVTNSDSNGISGYAPSTIIQNNLVSGFGTGGGLSAGVYIYADGKTIQNNLVGTDADGTSALANQIGVWINDANSQSTATIVGHNVISGNSGVGVQNGELTYGGTNFTVTGNYIGLDATGSPLGNGGDGIFTIGASDFTVGGTTEVDRNYIGANGGNGIHIFSQGDDGSGCSTSSQGSVIGNYIGTNLSGEVSTGFGNQESGVAINEIEINCSHGTIYNQVIGGDSAGQANTIAGNTLDGIRVYQVPESTTDVFSVAVLPNTIFGNGNLGVNLAADSAGSGTADLDLGPNVINNFLMSYPATNANYYINHPTINSVAFVGNDITVNYNLQANQADESSLFQSDVVGYRLDFYINDASQDGAYAGYNQAKTHLGSFIVNGSETNATHTFTSPITPTTSQSVNAVTTVLWAGDGPPY